jgi:tetratricopeptide (TPR) repeat protein
MFNIGLELFNQLSYSDEKKAALLSKLSKFKKEGINEEMIMSEFYRITQTVFLQNGEKDQYEKIYNSLVTSLSEESAQNQIKYIYNYENGRILYNQGRYSDAILYFEKAMAAKPNNVEMAGLFISNLAQLKMATSDKKKYVADLQSYATKYSLLRENNNFTTLLAQNLLEVIATLYEKGNASDGDIYKLQFESLADKNSSIIPILQYEIGRAYSAACVHYFKLGQKTKSRQFVDKGLTLAPNNYELKMRKEMLSR